MRVPTTSELLYLWEKGIAQSELEKTLELLSVACSISEISILANWDIGQRDARLFWLREYLFGQELINIANCPECAESVEWKMNISDFPMPEFIEEPRILELKKEDYQIQFRLPNSKDIMGTDPQQILEQCLLSIQYEEKAIDYEDLPKHIQIALNEAMENANPIAHISMLLNCPSCAHQWETFFDILSYLWTEIDHWARQTFQEIHLLASAFGWTEKEILELSPRRRQLYLEML